MRCGTRRSRGTRRRARRARRSLTLPLTAVAGVPTPGSPRCPGPYGIGTAGYIVGQNLNAQVSSRATQTSVDAVQADTDNLQTRVPAALVGGRMSL